MDFKQVFKKLTFWNFLTPPLKLTNVNFFALIFFEGFPNSEGWISIIQQSAIISLDREPRARALPTLSLTFAYVKKWKRPLYYKHF